MLHEEGVGVESTPPREYRSLGPDLNELAVSLTTTGTLAAIGLAVKKFRDWAPRAKVEIEGEDEAPDDGGSWPTPTQARVPAR